MIITGIAVVFLLVFFKLRLAPYKSNAIAKINGNLIYNSEFKEFSKNMKFRDINDKKRALDSMINQKIIHIYAEKSGILENELKPEFIKEQNYKFQQELIEYYFNKYLDENSKPSDAEIKDYYNNTELFTLYYLGFSNGADETGSSIETAKILLDEGLPFAEVFDRIHPDKKIESHYIGSFDLNDLEEEMPVFYEAVKNLPVDKYSKLLNTDFGKIILYRAKTVPLKKISSYLRDKLVIQKKYGLDKEFTENYRKLLVIDSTTIKEILDSKDLMDKDNLSKIIVRYSDNDDEITLRTFMQIARDLLNYTITPDLEFEEVLPVITTISVRQRMFNDAIRENLDNVNEFKKIWRNEKQALELEQAKKVIQHVIDKYSETVFKVSDDDVMKEYLAKRHRYRKSGYFKLQRLIVDDEIKAYEIYNSLFGGADFSEMVKTHSIEKNADYTLGITNYLKRDELKDHYEKLLPIKPGEISEPLKQDELYIIYKILDFQEGAITPYPEVQDIIRTELTLSKVENWVNKIKTEYNIEIETFYENLEN